MSDLDPLRLPVGFSPDGERLPHRSVLLTPQTCRLVEKISARPVVDDVKLRGRSRQGGLRLNYSVGQAVKCPDVVPSPRAIDVTELGPDSGLDSINRSVLIGDYKHAPRAHRPLADQTRREVGYGCRLPTPWHRRHTHETTAILHYLLLSRSRLERTQCGSSSSTRSAVNSNGPCCGLPPESSSLLHR